MKEEIRTLGYRNPLANGMKRRLDDNLDLSDECLLASDKETEGKDTFDTLFGATKHRPRHKKHLTNTYSKSSNRPRLRLKIRHHQPTFADYFASEKRHKQNLVGELGFDLNSALRQVKAPTSVKNLEELVKEEKNIDSFLKDDATEIQNAKERKLQLKQYIKDNLDSTFINDPVNFEYLKNLEKILSDEYKKQELYDFYFVVSDGMYGSTRYTKKYSELRSRILHGSGVPLEDKSVMPILNCLLEETQPSCVLQYLRGSVRHFSLQDVNTFFKNLGCKERILEKESDKTVKLMLNNKKHMEPQIIVTLKVYVLSRWVLDSDYYSDLMNIILRNLIYMMVDGHMNGTIMDESTIINGCRLSVPQILMSSFLDLSSKYEEIFKIVKDCLMGTPFLWFRFISNLVIFPGSSVSQRKSILNFRANCYLQFANEMGFNDTIINISKDKPQFQSKQDCLYLETKKDIYHQLVKLLRHLRQYKLKSDTLKDGPFEKPKKVDEANYLENKQAYMIAKLRMLSLEKLCFSYIEYLRYGSYGHGEKEIIKRLRKLKHYCMEIKQNYFHDFMKLVCPEITKSLSVMSFICERAQSEIARGDPF